MVVSENDLCKKQFAVFHGTGTLVAPLKQNRIAKGKNRRMSNIHNLYTQHLFSTYAWRRQQLRYGELTQ